MALISCPDCKSKISENASSCPKCGYRLTPELVTKIKAEEAKNFRIGCLGIIIIAIIISIFSQTGNKESNSSYQPLGNSSQSIGSETGGDKYVVKKETIFAATSETSFDLMMNCVSNGDKQALLEMVINGQLRYLYKNDIVYLVKAKFKYYIVRSEGSTELLYVVSELLDKQY